jgi:pimeloyl-ACP methyl ester carboxylesterase
VTTYVTDTVPSGDGTTIGYRKLGRGPGLVLVHGSASSAHNFMDLAALLSDSRTVYLPDRRGRGLSGAYDPDGFGIHQEVEDLDAILSKTGSRDVFGLSTGGVICLQASLSLGSIRRVAVFEPPLFADRAAPAAAVERFDREMARGDVAAALITAMKASEMGPRVLNLAPRWLLVPLTRRALQGEERGREYLSMAEIAPTLRYDLHLVAEMSGKQQTFGAIASEVLLLGGSDSPDYLKAALDDLERILPRAQRIELQGAGHAASWNADRGGQPERVARELRHWFARP